MFKRVIVRSFGDPEVLTLDSATPTYEPGPGQILVRLEAFGVNPVETYIRSGLYDPLPSLPYTPGNDGAGVIIAIGSGICETVFRNGMRVWISGSVSGTYAQQCLCSANDVHILPDHLTFAQGAALGTPYRTAYRALGLIAKAKARESVLIHGGTGGVGIATLQIARMLGLSPIIATTSSSDAAVRKLLTDNGATEVHSHDDPAIPRVDIIIEMLANANLGNDLRRLNRNGRVVIVGNRGTVTINPRDLMRCEGSIHGMVGAGSPDDKVVIDSFIQRGIDSGGLVPVVSEVYSLDRIQEAHVEIISHAKGSRGKIIVNPNV